MRIRGHQLPDFANTQMTIETLPAVTLIAPGRDLSGLHSALRARGVEHVSVWPDIENGDAQLAVLWNQPANALSQLPQLRAVMSLGAGVDFILADPSIDADLPVARIAGGRMAERMAGFLLATVLSDCRNLSKYAQDQKSRRWQPESDNAEPHIGFLGAGASARPAMRHFSQLGFKVTAWSRRRHRISGVTSVTGQDGLAEVASCDYLICLLPATKQTEMILGQDLFELTAENTTLIHVGRGQQLDADALIMALNSQRLRMACVDVFETEPLPRNHPLWQHGRVAITPHISALTPPDMAAAAIHDALIALANDRPIQNTVDRKLGY